MDEPRRRKRTIIDADAVDVDVDADAGGADASVVEGCACGRNGRTTYIWRLM